MFDCTHATCCVLMDSLFEVRDPGALLAAIVGSGPRHFLIRHPNVDRGASFLWDTTSQEVFTKRDYMREDLQVGDHVYIWNHPLYAELEPDGEWGGEHALVVDCRTRDLKRGFRFTGHGVRQSTIATLYADLQKTLQTDLNRAYRIASTFLDYLRFTA